MKAFFLATMMGAVALGAGAQTYTIDWFTIGLSILLCKAWRKLTFVRQNFTNQSICCKLAAAL